MATGTAVARNGNGGAIAPAKRKDFLATLEASREGIASMIPDPAKVDRVLRLVRTAWQMDAKIQACREQSIVGAVMKACELSLDPCGARKHCYLIPYANECTLQVSYMGMLELAHRSGCFKAIEARLVHHGDQFQHAYDPEPIFRHVPGPKSDDASATHAYADARLTTGALVIEVMTRDEIERIRRTAKAGNVWQNYWGEMAKKTVIKRLLKRQPSSVELAEAIEHDNEQYGAERIAVASGATASARLAAQLGGQLGIEDASQDTGFDPASESQEAPEIDSPELGANG